MIIIGDGEQKEELLLQIRKLNLEKKIEIIGYKKIFIIFEKIRLLYLNFKLGGISLSMIDAAYIGIPILCSDCLRGEKNLLEIIKGVISI